MSASQIMTMILLMRRTSRTLTSPLSVNKIFAAAKDHRKNWDYILIFQKKRRKYDNKGVIIHISIMNKYARDEKIHSELKHSKHKIGKDLESHLWYLCEFFLHCEDIQ